MKLLLEDVKYQKLIKVINREKNPSDLQKQLLEKFAFNYYDRHTHYWAYSLTADEMKVLLGLLIDNSE